MYDALEMNKDMSVMDDQNKPQPEKDEKSDAARMGDGYTLALHFVLSILICAGIGYWLDGFFGTKPWLMLGFLVLGFASALWKIYQQMVEDE